MVQWYMVYAIQKFKQVNCYCTISREIILQHLKALIFHNLCRQDNSLFILFVRSSDVDLHRSYPEPQNLVNADPGHGLKSN